MTGTLCVPITIKCGKVAICFRLLSYKILEIWTLWNCIVFICLFNLFRCFVLLLGFWVFVLFCCCCLFDLFGLGFFCWVLLLFFSSVYLFCFRVCYVCVFYGFCFFYMFICFLLSLRYCCFLSSFVCFVSFSFFFFPPFFFFFFGRVGGGWRFYCLYLFWLVDKGSGGCCVWCGCVCVEYVCVFYSLCVTYCPSGLPLFVGVGGPIELFLVPTSYPRLV